MATKTNLPKVKESDIQRDIKAYLIITGWFCFKIMQSALSYKGIPDLFAVKDGRNIWIEVKTPKGVLSEHQQRFKDDCKAHGGEFVVARSVDDVVYLNKTQPIRVSSNVYK